MSIQLQIETLHEVVGLLLRKMPENANFFGDK
eukprot:CAMPEP_0194534452 /NCGR_PEP_ID=MMETSP0253-20130528/72666_1 /TAXON_ID=2966 /ORGANISM="Noctiluca scintillans" /LENGTH=31 /DNA_ID= /DNA_START= /DNA_END= /DNA_ORIENTATION=